MNEKTSEIVERIEGYSKKEKPKKIRRSTWNAIIIVWMVIFSFISGGYVTLILINSDPYVEYVSFGHVILMESPEGCSTNTNETSPDVFLPYYFYTNIPLTVDLCYLTIDEEYRVTFRVYNNEEFDEKNFTAFAKSYGFYFRPSITFFHEDLLIVDLFDSNELLLASAITIYVDLE